SDDERTAKEPATHGARLGREVGAMGCAWYRKNMANIGPALRKSGHPDAESGREMVQGRCSCPLPRTAGEKVRGGSSSLPCEAGKGSGRGQPLGNRALPPPSLAFRPPDRQNSRLFFSSAPNGECKFLWPTSSHPKSEPVRRSSVAPTTWRCAPECVLQSRAVRTPLSRATRKKSSRTSRPQAPPTARG